MTLDPNIAGRLSLPAICAPMFRVSTPALVGAACKAGVIGALPFHNAASSEMFEGWLKGLREDLDREAGDGSGRPIAPLAVNFPAGLPADMLNRALAACRLYGVDIIISVAGDPTEMAKAVHDWGGTIYHDVTNLRFAEKAIQAGVDGLICIGAGGGGHSGTISPLVLIPQIRSIFDGTLVLAGAVGSGAVIRAAEVLGADLAYLGTRFIATRDAEVDEDYKQMLVRASARDLVYTERVGGVPANWLVESLKSADLDPADLPVPTGRGMRHDHLPPHARPWENLWSAGQAVELIRDIPAVGELVERLRAEYRTACQAPPFGEAMTRVAAADGMSS